MRPCPKLRPGLWDGLVVLAVAVLAAVCGAAVWGSAGGGESLTAVVTIDGGQETRVDLWGLERAEQTVTGNGYTLHIVLTEHEVWVEESDCPTQDCVHTGHISRSGQSIVCLPARVIVQLEGGPDQGVDAVVG